MTRLSFAIPSKGRLKDNTENWLAACGFKVRQLGGGRGYTATLNGLPDVDIMLLSASEIAAGLIAGDLHLGVTGEDLIHDLSSDAERDVCTFRRLGFGGANVIVAVPTSWLDVDTMADLEAAGAQFRTRHGRRMRVATKYLRLTRRFFATRSVGEYRLVESAGATEAAPAAGSAEVIVDITSTGATLKANGLKILSDGIILKSEAALMGSRTAVWDAEGLAPLRVLLDRVEARNEAMQTQKLEVGCEVPSALTEELGLTVLQSGAILCPVKKAANVARRLSLKGFGPVAISNVEHVFHGENAMFDSFIANLS